NTDEVSLKAMKSLGFIEEGTIRGILKYLGVGEAPFCDENGRLVGVIGTARVITEKILLKETNERLACYDQLTTLPTRQQII
ncbi:GGDEF domain-containing protein, partial [Aliarcobacter butzleri]